MFLNFLKAKEKGHKNYEFIEKLVEGKKESKYSKAENERKLVFDFNLDSIIHNKVQPKHQKKLQINPLLEKINLKSFLPKLRPKQQKHIAKY